MHSQLHRCSHCWLHNLLHMSGALQHAHRCWCLWGRPKGVSSSRGAAAAGGCTPRRARLRPVDDRAGGAVGVRARPRRRASSAWGTASAGAAPPCAAFVKGPASPVQVPVYVWAAEEEGQFQPGRCSRWWLHHSLRAFEADLAALGARLIHRRAPESCIALLQLIEETGAQVGSFSHCSSRQPRKNLLPARRLLGVAHESEVVGRDAEVALVWFRRVGAHVRSCPRSSWCRGCSDGSVSVPFLSV